MLLFEWDINKNIINIKKHGIDFKEVQSVFFDENGLLISDPDHSESEERFILIGMNNKAELIVVSHCYRSNEEIIRIISARKATKNEYQQYMEANGL